VVAFVLVGVGDGEPCDGLVEDVGTAQVGGDGDLVPGTGVRAGQGPAAGLTVESHAAPCQGLDVDGVLPVPQLADVVVMSGAVRAGFGALPAQEDVAAGLHQPLAGDHPLAHVRVLAG